MTEIGKTERTAAWILAAIAPTKRTRVVFDWTSNPESRVISAAGASPVRRQI